MEQTTWNFIFIGITFGVYIGIKIWSRAGSTKELHRQAVSPANGMATAADWMCPPLLSPWQGASQRLVTEPRSSSWGGPEGLFFDDSDGPLSKEIW